MVDIINILCATDDNYVPYCGIMLTSLFESNKSYTFNVFVLSEGLSDKNVRDLDLLVNEYGHLINFVVVDSMALQGCPIRKKDHVSLATYYRLLAPVLLPDSVDKVLYLDCDMIVDASIEPLWSENLEGLALAAVIDEDYLNVAKYDRLGLDPHKKYFNAGMLLINLKYWREHNVMQRCFDCITRIPEKLLLHDQDTLNVVLSDEVRHLPITYNFQTGFLYFTKPLEVFVKQEVRNLVKKNPAIIHYTGKRKPWLAHYYHPLLERYRYYRSISLWKDFPLVRTFKEEWRYYRHQFKFAMGWKSRPYITDKQKKSE